MFKSIKRAVATLAIVALMVTNSGIALAQTFNDVSTNAWYYDFVEQLVDQGIVDVADNYRPADSLNRAELTKMAITAIDGLADYQAPATPTFDDVPVDAWFYDYIEAAVQLGIVSGYTDAAGNLTGMFGPGDTVNRAAAAKILANAFAIPTTLTPATPFPDVNESDWFHDYVVTAYNQSVLDGYSDGTFKPANSINRAETAKLVVNAQNPVRRTEPGPGPGPGPIITPGLGDLEVSLNDSTALSSTIPQKASNVQLASFDFTAADDDVVLTNLIVTRGGVGQTGDWDALYIYEGAKRITTGRTINSDTNEATFPLNMVINAGTTLTLSLLGDVALTGVGVANQHYFYIASSGDITSNATSVAGDFPVAGNTFTMSGAGTAVNTVTVSAGTSPSQPQIGELDAEIAVFKLTAGAKNDIAVHSIALTNGGSLGSGKLENLRLLRGTDEVAATAGFDGDRVTFSLGTPYVIPEGQNKTFYVRADVNGGRSTDSIQLYIDENTDVLAIDQQFGYGAVVINNFGTAFAPTITLKGGDVTVTDNGPSAKQLAQNTTSNELLNFSLTTDRDLTVRNTFMQIDIQDTTATGPSLYVGLVKTLGASITVAGGGVAAQGSVQVTGGAVAADTFQVFIGGVPASVIPWTSDDITTAGLIAADIATIPGYTGANGGTDTVTITATVGGPDVSAVATTTANAAATVDIAMGGVTAGILGATDDTSNFCLPNGTPNIGVGDMVQMNAASGTVYAMIATQTIPSGLCGANDLYTTNLAVGDIVAPATAIVEVDPYDFVKNVRLIDLDTESTLAGPLTTANANSTALIGPPTSYNKVHTEDYELTGGETRHLSVQADLDQNMAAGYQIRAQVRYSDGVSTVSYMKDLGANEFVKTADIVGAGPVALAGKWMTSAANTLAVARAATPTSQLYVKGETHVPSLGIALTSGDAGEITVKRLLIRVYGDSAGPTGAWVNPTGDTAANTLISSVTLYDGNDVLAGPEGLSLVDAGPVGFDAASGDYYKAQFDDLNVLIEKGGTRNLTVKVKLLNTMIGPVYVALDVQPQADIIAEDMEANTITPTGTSLNNLVAHDPELTILNSGTLTASGEGNPDAAIQIAGATQQLVAKYSFNAVREAFTVNKITIVQDAAGAVDGFDNDPLEVTNAVTQLTIKYPDIDGVTRSKTGVLTAGSAATMSGLGFYVPTGTPAYLEVYADVSAMGVVGETLSGSTFRLGLQDVGNTVSTFEAVGEASSNTENFLLDTEISNSASVNSFVVRRTLPTFAKTSGMSSSLVAGENRLYGVTITADSAGGVRFGRLTFTVNNGGSGTLDDFKFYRGSTLLSDLITNAGNANVYSPDAGTPGDMAPTGGGSFAAGNTGKVIVSFNDEEIISAGQQQTYYLDATAGAAAANDSVQTKIAINDESDPVVGLTGAVCTGGTYTSQPNTGRIFSGTGTCSLFTANTAFVQADPGAGFSRDIVWTDRSNDTHGYPDMATTPGQVADGTGSYDWTNGYLLKVNTVTSHTLTK